MSPNEYNEDNFSLRERETIVTDIRSSYSFIFNQLVQIYKTHHQDEKLSTKAEEVADAVETLHNEGKITDYLYENFKSCYSQYPTMLVGNLVKEKEQVGADKQYERLKKLKGLLKLYIGDLSEEEKIKIRDDKYKALITSETGGKVVVETYRGSTEKADYRCTICGYEWSTRPDHFKERQGYKCPRCKKGG